VSEPVNNAKTTGAHWLRISSAVLMISGVALLLFYGSSLAFTARAHDQGLSAFEAARNQNLQAVAIATPAPVMQPALEEQSAEPIRAEVTDALNTPPNQSDWSEKRIADYEALGPPVGADQMPQGVMRIPSIDMVLPLYDGTEEYNLTRGAGIIEGMAPFGSVGNTGLAAHRDGYFRSLKDVSVGDDILVETLDAEYRYRIAEILIVNPEDVYVLESSDRGQLTLVTCYPFYFVGSAPQRYIVRADVL
jgi:sortase A